MSIWKNGKLVAGGRQTTPLLSFMWADHILDDISWLRADTFSWQSGAVYQAVYQHLANDIDGKSLQSETVGGTTIQFYLADDGHKICPESEMSNVAAIYAATGVAWYYIIDTVNERFKLPRSKHEHYGDRPVVGNANIGFHADQYTDAAGLQLASSGYNAQFSNIATSLNRSVNVKLHNDPTKSGVISTPVQDTDQYKYLYFYVGAFTQTALENTAGITAETLNDKVDKGHQVIEFQAPTAQNNYTWYRKYADGWVEQGGYMSGSGSGVTISLPVTMSNNYYTIVFGNESGQYEQLKLVSRTTTTFSAKITNSSGATQGCWQVSGMAA